MSLHEHPTVPDLEPTQAELDEAREVVTAPSKKRGIGRRALIGGAIVTAGAVLTTSLILGRGGEAPSTAVDPDARDRDTAGAKANPGEKEATEAPKEFGISAAEIGNDTKKLASTFYSQVDYLMIAGATHEAQDAPRNYEVDNTTYVAELSNPVNTEFMDKLFVPGWDQNANIINWADQTLAAAQRTRELRMLSWVGVEQNEDFEPYFRAVKLDSIEGSQDPLTTSTLWSEYDNDEKTNVVANVDDIVEENHGGDTIIWEEVDGSLRVADILPYTG